MSFLKKSVIASGLATAFFAASTAHSASLNVDTDITLPDVLILYAYTDIDLDFAAGEFASLVDSNCTADDCGVALTTAQTGTITGGVVDLDISTDVSSSTGAATVTIQNSWAVRGFGYTNFAASITDNGSEASVSNHAVSPTSGTLSSSFTYGDVSFDFDVANPDDNGNGTIDSDYTITVTGS